jgi:hypothetical protein
MIQKKNEVLKVIQMEIRRPLYNRVIFSSRSNATVHLYSEIFEQVRSQITNPLEENLIIPNSEKNEYEKYGRGVFKSPI